MLIFSLERQNEKEICIASHLGWLLFILLIFLVGIGAFMAVVLGGSNMPLTGLLQNRVPPIVITAMLPTLVAVVLLLEAVTVIRIVFTVASKIQRVGLSSLTFNATFSFPEVHCAITERKARGIAEKQKPNENQKPEHIKKTLDISAIGWPLVAVVVLSILSEIFNSISTLIVLLGIFPVFVWVVYAIWPLFSAWGWLLSGKNVSWNIDFPVVEVRVQGE